MTLMRALALKEGKLWIKEIPLPHPVKNEALIKVLKSGICNTDLEFMKGYMTL